MAKRSKSEIASGRCSNGHTYTPNNTGMSGDGRRYCRVCHAHSAAKRRAASAPNPRAPRGSLSGKKKIPQKVAPVPYIPIRPKIYTPHVGQSHDEWMRFHGIKVRPAWRD
jgi:hypothetical protein